MTSTNVTFDQVEQQGQEAEKRAQDEQKFPQGKPSGLSWHEALFQSHSIYMNPTIPIQHGTAEASSSTNAIFHCYPTRLRHWHNFHRLHRYAFKHISNHLAQPEVEAFQSRESYQNMAETYMSLGVLNDEVSHVANKQRTVEDMILEVWGRIGNGKIGFKGREGHPLDDVNGRVRQMNSRSEVAIRPTTTFKQQSDKVCSITNSQGASRDLFVIQCKAEDKLAPAVVKKGLRNMGITTIKEQIRVSMEKGKKKEDEMAEEAIAVVVTQTYDYMVNQGLSYGYINGGNTFIFLCTYPDNPKTLYYEKVFLKAASTTSSMASNRKLRLTALGLVAGFTQMALGKQQWSERLRNKARNEQPFWGPNGPQTPTSPKPTPGRPSKDSVAVESPKLKELNTKTEADKKETLIQQAWSEKSESKYPIEERRLANRYSQTRSTFLHSGLPSGASKRPCFG